jgi:hypothetical protein
LPSVDAEDEGCNVYRWKQSQATSGIRAYGCQN